MPVILLCLRVDRRRAACRLIDERAEADGGPPLAVIGDFNDDPYDDAADNAFVDTLLDDEPTGHFLTAVLPPESVSSTGWHHCVGNQYIEGEFIDHAVLTGALMDRFSAATPTIHGVAQAEFDDYRAQYSDHFPVEIRLVPCGASGARCDARDRVTGRRIPSAGLLLVGLLLASCAPTGPQEAPAPPKPAASRPIAIPAAPQAPPPLAVSVSRAHVALPDEYDFISLRGVARRDSGWAALLVSDRGDGRPEARSVEGGALGPKQRLPRDRTEEREQQRVAAVLDAAGCDGRVVGSAWAPAPDDFGAVAIACWTRRPLNEDELAERRRAEEEVQRAIEAMGPEAQERHRRLRSIGSSVPPPAHIITGGTLELVAVTGRGPVRHEVARWNEERDLGSLWLTASANGAAVMFVDRPASKAYPDASTPSPLRLQAWSLAPTGELRWRGESPYPSHMLGGEGGVLLTGDGEVLMARGQYEDSPEGAAVVLGFDARGQALPALRPPLRGMLGDAELALLDCGGERWLLAAEFMREARLERVRAFAVTAGGSLSAPAILLEAPFPESNHAVNSRTETRLHTACFDGEVGIAFLRSPASGPSMPPDLHFIRFSRTEPEAAAPL